MENLPAFFTAMQTRAIEVKWNAPYPHGILNFGVDSPNLLKSFRSVDQTTIKAAHTSRTDPGAKQNAKAMYKYLSSSVTGDLRSSLFEQLDNLPTNEDGPTLFKRMIDSTVAATMQVSNQALMDLQLLEPAEFQYNLSLLNTKAAQLFHLAGLGAREIPN